MIEMNSPSFFCRARGSRGLWLSGYRGIA